MAEGLELLKFLYRPATVGRDLQTSVLKFLQGDRKEGAFVVPEEGLEGESSQRFLVLASK